MNAVSETPRKTRLINLEILSLGAPLLGVLVGLAIGAVLMLISGADPLESYAAMFKGAFGGSRQITETLLKATPILLIALGLTIAFRARVWNIGCEGQYFIGALFGGLVALYWFEIPQPWLWIVILAAGILGGMVWGFIPAIFKIRFGMNEIISTLMLNYIAIFFVTYLARGPLQEPGGYCR